MIKRDYSKLRGRMAEIGLSQRALAKAVGLSATAINNKLTGKVQFNQDEILSVLSAIRVPVDNVVDYFFS